MFDFLKRNNETTRKNKASLAYVYCMNFHMFNLAAECRQNLSTRVNKNLTSNLKENEVHQRDDTQITLKRSE